MARTLLQINTVINYNATGKIAEDIGSAACAKGWTSYIAYGRNTRDSRSHLIKVGSTLSFRWHVLMNRLLDNHGAGSIFATLKLIRAIRKIQPDIIHLHNIHGYYLHIGLLLRFLAKVQVPIVWTLHDCWAFTGHCAYFDYAHCTKWKNQCFDCPQKSQYPKSWLLDRSKQNYLNKKKLTTQLRNLTLVTVSNWQANLLQESFLRQHPVQVIHNGIDLQTFSPASSLDACRTRLGIPSDKTILLGVASAWEPRKGLQDFIRLNAMTDSDTLMILVGLPEKSIQQLPANILAIRRTENVQQLAELYSIADLFLNLTYEDNYPTTNLEALACGTPVLTYRTGGSIESVDDNTGFIVEKGDLQQVIKAINTLKEKGKKSYSSHCRKKAEELFDKNINIENYFALYHSLLNKAQI